MEISFTRRISLNDLADAVRGLWARDAKAEPLFQRALRI